MDEIVANTIISNTVPYLIDSSVVLIFSFIAGIVANLGMGPACILVINRSIQKDFTSGLATALAIILIDCLYVAIANFGIQSIITSLEKHQDIFRLGLGVIFFILGFILLIKQKKTQPNKNEQPDNNPQYNNHNPNNTQPVSITKNLNIKKFNISAGDLIGNDDSQKNLQEIKRTIGQQISSYKFQYSFAEYFNDFFSAFLLVLINPGTLIFFLWASSSFHANYDLTNFTFTPQFMVIGTFLGSLVWFLVLIFFGWKIKDKIKPKYFVYLNWTIGTIMLTFSLYLILKSIPIIQKLIL